MTRHLPPSKRTDALGPVTFGDAMAKSVDDRGRSVPEVARAIAALRMALLATIDRGNP